MRNNGKEIEGLDKLVFVCARRAMLNDVEWCQVQLFFFFNLDQLVDLLCLVIIMLTCPKYTFTRLHTHAHIGLHILTDTHSVYFLHPLLTTHLNEHIFSVSCDKELVVIIKEVSLSVRDIHSHCPLPGNWPFICNSLFPHFFIQTMPLLLP